MKISPVAGSLFHEKEHSGFPEEIVAPALAGCLKGQTVADLASRRAPAGEHGRHIGLRNVQGENPN